MSLPSLIEINLQSTGTFSQTGPADLEVQPWDVLRSKHSEYKLQYQLFAGCFSNVGKYKNVQTKDIMAVKIFKERSICSLQPNGELVMMKKIRGLNPENIVQFFDDFEHKGRTCLAFEMLYKNLHEFLKERHENRLSLLEIKPIAQQLLTALQSLKTIGVIHTNIKPQNIMLTRQKDLSVKLIGFGSAIAAAEVQQGVIMQPVAYRSPDVILGLPISEAVDVWSLGGVLATMFLGSLPFPQRCQYHQVKTMVKMLGQPEDTLLSEGAHTLLYFSPNHDSTTTAWRLNTVREYEAATGFPPQNHSGSSTMFNCLNDLMMLNPEENVVNKSMFVFLLREMLHMNPQKRITPSNALHHLFITLTLYGEEVVAPAAAEPSWVVRPSSWEVEPNSWEVELNSWEVEPNSWEVEPNSWEVEPNSWEVEPNSWEVEPNSWEVEDVPAVCSNDTSVDAAVSAHSSDTPAMTGVNNDVSAVYEASESTASDRDILTSESVSAVSAPVGGDPNGGASYDRATDATAGSAGDDEEASSASGDEACSASGDEASSASDDDEAGTAGDDDEAGSAGDDEEASSASGDEACSASGDEASSASDDDEAGTAGEAGSAGDDEEASSASGDEACSASGDEASSASDDDEAGSAGDDEEAGSAGGDEEAGSAGGDEAGSRKRRVRRFFGRMFSALCCCAANVEQ